METDQPLLTIAIPTFNRAKYLRQLLSSLFDQLLGRTDVELVVSDNASSDDTSTIIGEFQMRGLILRYLRNSVDIGSDANFRQCFEQAQGKYVWICGDDDIVIPGAISKILKLLDAEEYALAYITPYWFRNDHEAERTRDRFGRFAQVLPGGLQFAQRTGAMIGFLSSMIVNKNIYSTIPHRPLAEYDGTNLMQIGWVCPLLTSDSRSLLVWERLLAARGANTSGWGICQVFGVNFKATAEVALVNRKDIARALQAATLQRWFPDMIMEVRRGTGSKLQSENMRGMLEPIYSGNWRYWVYVFPLIILPLKAAQGWFSAVLLLRRLGMLSSFIVESIFSKKSFITEPD
jgi:abequosyltransferase